VRPWLASDADGLAAVAPGERRGKGETRRNGPTSAPPGPAIEKLPGLRNSDEGTRDPVIGIAERLEVPHIAGRPLGCPAAQGAGEGERAAGVQELPVVPLSGKGSPSNMSPAAYRPCRFRPAAARSRG